MPIFLTVPAFQKSVTNVFIVLFRALAPIAGQS